MTIYEEFADHENWYGRPVACCNIHAFWIIKHPWEAAELEPARKQGIIDDDTTIITEAKFKEMFEQDFDEDDVKQDDDDDNRNSKEQKRP